MSSTRVKNKRQYDPPEYDDTSLMKWLRKDKKRANADMKEKNKNHDNKRN